MADYELDNTQGDYNSAYPPKVLDYQDVDMTKEPFITVDKARFDIFKQYTNEYKLIWGMIPKLHRTFEGGRGTRDSSCCSAPVWARLLHLPGIPRPS